MNNHKDTLIHIMEVNNTVHEYVDNEIKKYPKPCKQGCDHCCYQSVNVITWEEMTIFKFIHDKLKRPLKRKISSNIKNWFNFFNQNTREADKSNPLSFVEYAAIERKFRESKIPCPFLVDRKCSIYEARPMVCRIHHVKDNPSQCKTDPHTQAPEYTSGITYTGVSMYDQSLFPVAWKPLAYLVGPTFVDHLRAKPIMGIIANDRGRAIERL